MDQGLLFRIKFIITFDGKLNYKAAHIRYPFNKI